MLFNLTQEVVIDGNGNLPLINLSPNTNHWCTRSFAQRKKKKKRTHKNYLLWKWEIIRPPEQGGRTIPVWYRAPSICACFIHLFFLHILINSTDDGELCFFFFINAFTNLVAAVGSIYIIIHTWHDLADEEHAPSRRQCLRCTRTIDPALACARAGHADRKLFIIPSHVNLLTCLSSMIKLYLLWKI